MDLYYLVHGHKVIEINTEELEGYKQLSGVENQDDLQIKFQELGLEIEDSVFEEIQEIFGLDNGSSEESIEEFRIKHWVSNRSFGELVDMYKHGEIKTPEMQRKLNQKMSDVCTKFTNLLSFFLCKFEMFRIFLAVH